jgi:hypothetical protein
MKLGIRLSPLGNVWYADGWWSEDDDAPPTFLRPVVAGLDAGSELRERLDGFLRGWVGKLSLLPELDL